MRDATSEGVSGSGRVAENAQQLVDAVGVRCRRLRVSRLFVDAIVVVAHPLLAAATRRRLQAGVGAAPCGQGHVVGAERHAANHAVHAAALVLTAGLEILAVLVDAPSELTRPSLGVSWRNTGGCKQTLADVNKLC